MFFFLFSFFPLSPLLAVNTLLFSSFNVSFIPGMSFCAPHPRRSQVDITVFVVGSSYRNREVLHNVSQFARNAHSKCRVWGGLLTSLVIYNDTKMDTPSTMLHFPPPLAPSVFGIVSRFRSRTSFVFIAGHKVPQFCCPSAPADETPRSSQPFSKRTKMMPIELFK